MMFETAPLAGPLRGTLRVPGDKSISHRAVLFAAMAEGTSELSGVLDSADVWSTLRAVTALGATVELVARRPEGLEVAVTGWGALGPHQPSHVVDCGNSGTTARLLMGALAPWPITVTLDGDTSLQKRPMRRVTEPLKAMGAVLKTTDGHLPVVVAGGPLRALRFESPVASAQVKTAVLLAGLQATGTTTVLEPAQSRDHTERLLPAFGVGVTRDARARSCAVTGPVRLSAADVAVPADPSSAAFVVAAAVTVPGSDVTLTDVALNPTRTGFLRVLERMGARVECTVKRAAGAEPTGTIRAQYSEALHGTVITADEVPSLVDEVPVLAVVACQAKGTTRFEGVAELRVKESDRLSAIVEGLCRMGATARSGDGWLEVEGGAALHGARLSSLKDHLLAMAWAVAGLRADSPVEIALWEAIEVSYPAFADDMASLASD